MNWATIAPETRLYKGKNIFKWEDSPGLEHHCGVCATPLHNSRAKTSCIGKHVEPCYRFHQQLHFVGKSHECFGCNSSDECHHNRHKTILKLARQITAIDKEAARATTNKLLFGKPKRASEIPSPTLDTSSESHATEDAEDLKEAKLTRRERKKLRKSGNNSVKERDGMEVFPQEEIDFVSEAIHMAVHESKGAWEGTYNYSYKQEDKETPEEETQDEDEADVDTLTTSVHDLAVKCPSEMTPRQRRVQKKFTSSIDHSSFNGGSRRYSSPKPDPFDGVDPEIFTRLGIELANPMDNSKERKELATKLVAAVKDDLNTIKREDDDTVMREEGFWRWAGRTAYHHIQETRENFDWATGQKRGLPRIEETEDDEEFGQGEIDGRSIPPVPDSESSSLATPTHPAGAFEEEEDGFTTAVYKKSVIKKEPTSITIQTGRYQKPLNLPPPASPNNSESDEDQKTDDFKELVRRQQQKAAGNKTIGGWNQTRPSYFTFRRGHGKK